MPTRYLHSNIMYALGLVTGPDDPGPTLTEEEAKATMNKREFARYIKSMQKPDPKPKAYGVYVHRGDGQYQHSEPVATYKHQKVAQKKADYLNETDPVYVVRTIW